MSKTKTFDHSKMYLATLTDGLSFNLGLRRFVKDEPQRVTGEVAEILSKKGFPVDVQKAKGQTEAGWQAYFTLEETDEDVPAGASVTEGTPQTEKEEKKPAPAQVAKAPAAAPTRAPAVEGTRGNRTVRRAGT